MEIDNLISGLVGAIIGAIIVGALSYRLFFVEKKMSLYEIILGSLKEKIILLRDYLELQKGYRQTNSGYCTTSTGLSIRRMASTFEQCRRGIHHLDSPSHLFLIPSSNRQQATALI